MWEYTFDAPVNERIMNSRFHGVTVFGDWSWWYVPSLKKWAKNDDDEVTGLARGSHFNDCHSFKAFKRHLRKYGDVLKGSEVVLCSRYVGCDIVAKWNDKLHVPKQGGADHEGINSGRRASSFQN